MMGKSILFRRGIALLLACLLAIPFGIGTALGEMDMNVPYFITVSWLDNQLVVRTAQAMPVQIPGYEDCYWVQVSPDAPLDGLQMEIADFTGRYASFSPGNGSLLPPVSDAGDSIDMGDTYIEIMAKTADGHPGALIYLYVSTVAAAPMPPQAAPTQAPTPVPTAVPTPVPTAVPTAVPVQPVNVNIHYVDEQGSHIANSTVQTVPEGTHAVYAAPYNLPENYHLSGENYQYVTVSQWGADQTDIYFRYRFVQPATPAPVQGTVRVRLLEVSSNRELYAYDASVILGQNNDIFADTSMLAGEYVPVGDTWQQIYVDERGNANPAPVFYFISNATPVPTQTPFAAQPAQVAVLYLSLDDGLPVAMEDTVSCPPGRATDVYPNPVGLIEGFVLVSEPVITVRVDAFGQPDRYEVVFLYQLAGGESNTPQLESRDITVWYYSLDMQQIASPTRFTCYPGMNAVYPAPFDLKSGYELIGDDVQFVELNEQGISATDIAFYYQRVYQPTPAPVNVRVQYLSWDGQSVAQEQWVSCPFGQETLIQANPQGLLADYVLDSSSAVSVRVDEKGTSPDPVIFYYRYAPNVPAPKIALVPVKYVRPDGVTTFYTYTETCVEGIENIIRVDLSRMEAGYELASDPQVKVTVNSDGSWYPGEVIFQFRNEVNAYVTVYYQDFNGRNVASPQQVLCFVGNNSIMAQPVDLQGGYSLAGDNIQYVVLSQDGLLAPGSVVFRYAYTATATPVPGTPSPFPYEYTVMDGYCYPRNDNVNFRSEPSTALDTSIISRVSRRDLAHIKGKVRNFQNEIWYHVSVGGQDGFLKDTVVRLLTEAEVAALFNYTLAPTQIPTPAPTPVPDGAVIDRWALTNAGGLNFRRAPETGNNVIRQINKNTQVWVYSSQTVDGEKWYQVRVNGTDGYLMAKYLNLYSQQESDLLQYQLSSPMPTQVPAPTQIPTLAPTQIPTLAPTLIPTLIPTLQPLPTPVPYRGYAITLWMSALRTGIGQGDESVLEMVPADTLVYVEWQNTVDGITWSSVQNMRTNARGFMLDEGLRPITQEEAKYYLNAMQPVSTATPEPMQQEGYAVTLGDGVPMRAFPDTNGEIIQLLPVGVIASVRGQMYDGNTGWHMVQYNGDWGFIRQDQLRMLTPNEALAYENSLQGSTPVPLPSLAPTAAPITQNSLSSYGHVQSRSGRVNLRSAPSTDSSRIRLLDNYAFALVMDTIETEEGTWYHVSQAGTEGYISGEYFKVLTLGELSQFLQSQEYLNANQSSSSSSTGNTTTQIQPVEDYNKTVWQNPALQASYEPFNPYVTPSPDPERLPTPAPTQPPTPAPTVYIAQIGPMGGLATPAPTTKTTSLNWLWVPFVIAIVGAGAAIYAYSIHRKNEQRRRQAMRAQQARQARAAAAAQPQMRTARNNPVQATRSYQAPPSASYMPPHGGSPRPAPMPGYQQGDTGRLPRTQAPAPQQGGVPATTNPFRPVTQRQADAYRASLEERNRAQAARGETQRVAPLREESLHPETRHHASIPAENKQEPQAFSPAQRQDYTASGQENRTYHTIDSAAAPVTHQRQRRTSRYQMDQTDSDV